MGRWLFFLSCCGVLAGIAQMEPRRSEFARGLGGVCETTAGCRIGLTCEDIDGALDGQCSAPCNSDAACQQQPLRVRALCIGADRCVMGCDHHRDCPADTVCNAFGWCERQKLDG